MFDFVSKDFSRSLLDSKVGDVSYLGEVSILGDLEHLERVPQHGFPGTIFRINYLSS